MIPKKYKTLLSQYSNNTSNPELTQDIINFYWDEVADLLRNKNHTTIYVEKFGEFKIKHWQLTKKILEFTELIKNNPGQTFTQRIKKEESKQLLDKMVKLQKDFAEEYSNKLNKKSLRHEFERSQKNME